MARTVAPRPACASPTARGLLRSRAGNLVLWFAGASHAAPASRNTMEVSQTDADSRQANSTLREPKSASVRARVVSWWKAVKPALPFVASWLLLDVMLNLRYPQEEPLLWYCVPSVDVIGLFFYLAVFGWNRWRVPVALRIVLVAFVFLVRFIRFGDGVQRRYYFQPFNVYTDLPLVPNLVRFFYSTTPWWKFSLFVALALGLVVALAVGTYRALACAERYLSEMRNVRRVAVVTVASFVLLSLLPRDPAHAGFFFGGFGESAIPRLKHEAQFLLNVYGYSAEKTQAIVEAQARLAREPADLAKLHHANVYLILVESYGQATFDQPFLDERSHEVFDSFESELTARGFSIASGVLDSPTYGGQSWLAHATLATTVRTADQLQYELLHTQKPKTMARFFSDAGYRTVLVQPGTTRSTPKQEFHQFEHRYYAQDFHYAGPSFAWATMPDQYVLDFIRRKEIETQKGPLFVQYTLVSSHAPWSHQPVVVDDWSQLGDGSIYNRLPMVRFPITWPDFADASEAYVRSIIYDFDVLKRYIASFVRDDSLIILLGDHQPVREVSGGEGHRGVPVHVVSRDAAFLEPFLARGYVRGMRPRLEEPHPRMEEFLV